MTVNSLELSFMSIWQQEVSQEWLAFIVNILVHEIHRIFVIPGCKIWVMRCWRGYLSGMRCKWFAYGPPDATATPSSLASLKSRFVLPFWCRITQVVLENRLLNGCLLQPWPWRGVYMITSCNVLLFTCDVSSTTETLHLHRAPEMPGSEDQLKLINNDTSY